MVIYVVQPGDTLESIAREYGVPLSRLISQNELDESGNITVGQTIIIPKKKEQLPLMDIYIHLLTATY